MIAGSRVTGSARSGRWSTGSEDPIPGVRLTSECPNSTRASTRRGCRRRGSLPITRITARSESKKHFARHLRAELDSYPTLHGATVDLVHGTYEERFPEVIEYLATAYRRPVPTFAFVDPRGYADNPFSRIEAFKRRMPTKSEVMVYLPASFMARFVATGKTAAALTKLYGGPTWEDAMDEGSRQRAGERLAGIFGDRLSEHFDWVTSSTSSPSGATITTSCSAPATRTGCAR